MAVPPKKPLSVSASLEGHQLQPQVPFSQNSCTGVFPQALKASSVSFLKYSEKLLSSKNRFHGNGSQRMSG